MKKLIILLVLLSGCLGKEQVPSTTSCIVTKDQGLVTITCPDGSSGTVKDGTNGSDGQSCSVLQVSPGDLVLPLGGAIINCPTSKAIISNGADGLDGDKGDKGDTGSSGAPGQDAPASIYSIVDIVNPCGESPQVYDEVFLKLANGKMLWLLVDNNGGKNPRLSISEPGDWITTDGDQCHFTLTSDGRIINESHHYE